MKCEDAQRHKTHRITSKFISHRYIRTDARYKNLGIGSQETLEYAFVEKDMNVSQTQTRVKALGSDRVGGDGDRRSYVVLILGRLWRGRLSG